MRQTKLNIFGYIDFRAFLNDRLDELKRQNAKYSQRYFCKRLGIRSNSYLQLIIKGKRNLTDALFENLVIEIGLTTREKLFFRDLVAYGQAKTTTQGVAALQKLRRNKHFVKVHNLELDRFDYYADPLTLTLRELVAVKGFKEDPHWIMQRVPYKTTPLQIRDAIESLIRYGHLLRDENKSLKVAHKHQETGSQLGAVPIRSYHLNMLRMAGESMELPTDQRYFQGLTMSIPKNTYDEIVEQFALFQDRIRAIVDASGEAEGVYQLQMALFPLTKQPYRRIGTRKDKP